MKFKKIYTIFWFIQGHLCTMPMCGTQYWSITKNSIVKPKKNVTWFCFMIKRREGSAAIHLEIITLGRGQQLRGGHIKSLVTEPYIPLSQNDPVPTTWNHGQNPVTFRKIARFLRWDVPRYTTRKGYIIILYHAIENTVASKASLINGRYAQTWMVLK